MELRHLRCFMAVAEALDFARAAEPLQPMLHEGLSSMVRGVTSGSTSGLLLRSFASMAACAKALKPSS